MSEQLFQKCPENWGSTTLAVQLQEVIFNMSKQKIADQNHVARQISWNLAASGKDLLKQCVAMAKDDHQCTVAVEAFQRAKQDHRDFYCLFRGREVVRVDVCLDIDPSGLTHAPPLYRINIIRGTKQGQIPLPQGETEYVLSYNRYFDCGYLSAEDVLAAGYMPFLQAAWQQVAPRDIKSRMIDAFLSLKKQRQVELLTFPRIFSWCEDGY